METSSLRLGLAHDLYLKPKPGRPQQDTEVLKAAEGLVSATWALYQELQRALPDFAAQLETILRSLTSSLADGRKDSERGQNFSQATHVLLQHLSPALCDVSRHTFTMATSTASLESFLLPDNQTALQAKARLEELNQLAKELLAELSSPEKQGNSYRSSNTQEEEAKNFWELLFGNRKEIELGEFYAKISSIIGREPRCPKERLECFFSCKFVDQLNFDRFTSLLDANTIQTGEDKMLCGTATSISQFLKNQIRIGHLRHAIPQGGSRQPIKALDSRTRSLSNDSLTSPRFELTLSPRSENGDVSATLNQSELSRSTWLKMKVETWFREVDRLYRFFHGDLTQSAAETLLRGQLPGTFLLRYSSANPSRLCVSFVHSQPMNDLENIRRRDVIRHHELICTTSQQLVSPRQGADISRSFTRENRGKVKNGKKVAVSGKIAFSALHAVMKSGALLEDSLKPPRVVSPDFHNFPGL